MDMLLLGITVVSLVVALVMSVTAWRLSSEEKRRSAARVSALSMAAGEEPAVERRPTAARPKAPWAPAPAAAPPAVERPSGFLGSSDTAYASGSTGRQHGLAMAAVVLFAGLAAGLFWMAAEPRGSSAAAMGPNAPLELVSLRHERKDAALAVSGLVRNPLSGHAVERVSAVVLLFDQQGTFVTSATAPVDFVKLGAGDESPFVVSLDAPATVARYRVSFRTNDGVVPHVDRRGEPPVAAQPVSARVP